MKLSGLGAVCVLLLLIYEMVRPRTCAMNYRDIRNRNRTTLLHTYRGHKLELWCQLLSSSPAHIVSLFDVLIYCSFLLYSIHLNTKHTCYAETTKSS